MTSSSRSDPSAGTVRSDAPDVPQQAALDALCRTAAALVAAATAVIGGDRILAQAGAPLLEGAGVLTEMRGRAIASGAVAVVENAARDPRLAAGLPDGAAGGFCAAVPLRTAPAAAPCAALVLYDPAPRVLSEAERQQLAGRLEDLAAIAAPLLRWTAPEHAEGGQAEFYRLLAENSTDTIVRGNLDGVRLYVSPAVQDLLGYSPEELIGRRAAEIVHADDLPAFRVLMEKIRDGRIELGRSEQRQRHRNGTWVWLEAFVKLTRDPVTGAADGYVASVRDISRRKAAEVRLAHMAAHDALTRLPNRSLMRERLQQHLEQAAGSDEDFAVLCLDLDHFKQVNDTLGHEAGDAVLCAAAQRLQHAVRAQDTVARVGGDEFVVIPKPGGNARADAARLAGRLITAMAEPVDALGTSVRVGLSVGIAVATPAQVKAGLDADGLLRTGDKALYAAKQAGRNRFVVAGEAA